MAGCFGKSPSRQVNTRPRDRRTDGRSEVATTLVFQGPTGEVASVPICPGPKSTVASARWGVELRVNLASKLRARRLMERLKTRQATLIRVFIQSPVVRSLGRMKLKEQGSILTMVLLDDSGTDYER